MSIEKNITRLFEEIDSSKNHINEILSDNDELFGGLPVRIPRDGSHAGQSGWASSNAWDIAGQIGTPVYALTAGQATTFTDYGSKVIVKDGKRLFGQSFTVKSYNGLPSVYYTHLTGSPIRRGSEVSCGEFLGVIMDFPGSSYDHVHIGVQDGNIRQFLNDDGTLKCTSGEEISGTLLGGIALGGAAAGAVALSGKEGSTENPNDKSSEFQFAGGVPTDPVGGYEFAGVKKSERIKENINRIKKIL